jgi:4-amino-4-deoxy-L-arabinose transferase-like glycosyltransferase
MSSVPTAVSIPAYGTHAGLGAAAAGTFRRALWLALLLAAGQVALFGLAVGLTYSAPEIDSAEQFVWSFSLENGYWKHPPMPSWIMHALVDVFGPSVVLPFIAAQACTVIALLLTWRLACEFMTPNRALVAMALTSLVTYHNIGADSFNHSTALLPAQAAMVLFFYLAVRRGDRQFWLLAGLFAGLAVLVKYTALLPIAALLLYFVTDRRLHTWRQTVGLALAGAVFALTILPHLLWLESTNFLPFRYAQAVAQAAPGTSALLLNVADFLLAQLVRLLPFALGLWFVLRRRFAESPAAPVQPLANEDTHFLWLAGVGPLALTVLYAIATATELQSRWGSNEFLLAGVLALAAWPRAVTAETLRRTLWVVAIGQVVLCLGQTLSKSVIAESLQRPTRANFPGELLAREARATWARHTERPLRLVVSDIWLGGNVVANSRHQRVAVLIDGLHFKSPWVRAGAVDACGALILDDLTPDRVGRDAPNPALDALMERADDTGIWTLPWAQGAKADPAKPRGLVRWGVILPRGPGECRLR